MPGTGVKILDDAVRLRVAPGDLPVDRWISIVTAAHRAGFRSTSVMVYGNGESAADRVGHLRRLIELQSSTGGFTEFVPMPAVGQRPARPGGSQTSTAGFTRLRASCCTGTSTTSRRRGRDSGSPRPH